MEGVASRAVTAVRSNASGVAVIRVFETLPAGIVSLGGYERRIFEVLNEPSTPQPFGANWLISWQFMEVLPNEISDPVEVDLW
jgi:hypothetical protein